MNKYDIVILNPVNTVLFNGVDLGYTSGGIRIIPELNSELLKNQRSVYPVSVIFTDISYRIEVPMIELNNYAIDFLKGNITSGSLVIRGMKLDEVGTEVTFNFYSVFVENIDTIEFRKDEPSVYTITFRAIQME